MISLSKDTFSKFQIFVQQLYMYSNVLKRERFTLSLCFPALFEELQGLDVFLAELYK